MNTPIHHTFGPLVTKKQFKAAWLLQWQPWRWRQGKAQMELKETLEHHFAASVYTFSTGREALYTLLLNLHLQPGDEVIVPAYTCIVVPNAVIAAGGTPVYCDVLPHSLIMDPNSVRTRVSHRTKAIICQHTFGIAVDTAALRTLCDEHAIHLIEDCAHILPAEEPNAVIGTYGDSILLSFGRDKAISGVSGGAIIIRNPALANRVQNTWQHAALPTLWQITKWIGYPLWYQAAKHLWRFGLGKPYLYMLAKLRLMPVIVTPAEKNGIMEKHVKQLPNACALLALQQWNMRGSIIEHRRMLTYWYKTHISQIPQQIQISTNASLQKFPLLVEHRDALIQALKVDQIYLQDGWSGAVINPTNCSMQNVQYTLGSCPNAEYVAAHMLSLPTHPTMTIESAAILVDTIQNYIAHNT